MEDLKSYINKLMTQKFTLPPCATKSMYYCPKCQNIINVASIKNNIITMVCEESHKTSITKDNVTEIYNNIIKEPDSTIECSQCHSQVNQKSIVYCLQEQKFFCSNCQKMHQTNHKTINDSQKLTHCPTHGDVFISFCSDHLTNLCQSCLAEHSSCKIVKLEDARPKDDEIKNFERKIIEQINKVKETEINLYQHIIKLIDCYQTWKENTTSIFCLYKTFINSYKANTCNFNLMNNLNEVMKKPVFPEFNIDIEVHKFDSKTFQKQQEEFNQFFRDYAEQKKLEEEEDLENMADELKQLENEMKMESGGKDSIKNVKKKK